MRLTDADALIVSLAKGRSALVNNRVPKGELCRIDEAIWTVVEAPTIEAVPVVHGEWIKKSSELTETLALCSKCSYPVAFWHKTNYCPNCGAKMDKEVQDAK